MAIVNRTVLKTYFETGDFPTQAQFIDLIDSCFNLAENNTWANGMKLIDADNSDSYMQLGDSGEKVILLNTGGAAITVSEAGGWSLQASGSDAVSQSPTGGMTISDEDSLNLIAPEFSNTIVTMDMGNALIKFNSSGGGVTSNSAANNFIGQSQLVSGTKTVNNSYIKSGAVIFVIWTGTGTLTGQLKQGAIVNGTSFVIASSVGTDTAQFNYIIFNPN